jgi:hypothetical protein
MTKVNVYPRWTEDDCWWCGHESHGPRWQAMFDKMLPLTRRLAADLERAELDRRGKHPLWYVRHGLRPPNSTRTP